MMFSPALAAFCIRACFCCKGAEGFGAENLARPGFKLRAYG